MVFMSLSVRFCMVKNSPLCNWLSHPGWTRRRSDEIGGIYFMAEIFKTTNELAQMPFCYIFFSRPIIRQHSIRIPGMKHRINL